MDDVYRINVAKTEFREAYNCGDVDQLLSVFGEENIMDMSDGEPTRSTAAAAREGLRKNSTDLFAEFSVRLAVIVGEIAVFGNTAYDFGWHEFTLTPKKAGNTIRKRHRYLELWKKNSSGDWKICFFINNLDVPEELLGEVSHWFLGEERSETSGGSMGS